MKEADGTDTYFAVYLDEQDGADGPKAKEVARDIIGDFFLNAPSGNGTQ